MKKVFYVLAILLFFFLNLVLVHTVASQSKPPSANMGTIKGIIKDKDTGKPIKGDMIIKLGINGPNGKAVSFVSSANLNRGFISAEPTIFLIVEKENYMPYKETFPTKEVIEANVFLEKLPAISWKNMSIFLIITIISFICLLVFFILQEISEKKAIFYP